ncbi:MAG: hypothetical protein IKF01_04190 [Bacilli bacterium]|nr:hypothetical protein [Bacilli bacterium]
MNNEMIKSEFDDEIYAVLLDEICPLQLRDKLFIYDNYMSRKEHYKKRKELNDIVFVLNRSKEIRRDYITGKLCMKFNKLFFKPTCFDSEILIASDAAIFDVDRFNSGFMLDVLYSDFSSLYGELKVVDLNNASRIPDFFVNYPDEYATNSVVRNLVLNYALCININSLKKLSSFEDDGIWELMFNEKFGEDYSKELMKRKLYAQRDLINKYLEIDSYYRDINSEDAKVKRKDMIVKLFGK